MSQLRKKERKMKTKKKRFLISAKEKDVEILDKICSAMNLSRSEFLIEVLFYDMLVSSYQELNNKNETNKKEEN